MITADYIRGFADGEGTVSLTSYSTYMIRIVNTDFTLLSKIALTLTSMGIKNRLNPRKVYGKNDKPQWELRIHGLKNLMAWRDKIDFDSADKKERLNDLLAYYNPRYVKTRSVDWNKIREQHYAGVSYAELGRLHGVDHSSIRYGLGVK